MAVKTPGEEPSNTLGAAFKNATPASAATQPRRAGGSQTNPSILQLNQKFRRPIGRNQTGEIVQGFVNAINAEIKASMGANFVEDFNVFVLDNNANMVALSTILVTLTTTHLNESHCAVFQLVIEGSAGKLVNKFISIGNQQVEIDVVPGDVIDRILWDKSSTFIQETFGKKLVMHNAGSMVLPTELSYENKAHIHNVVFTATQALYQVMDNDVTGAEAPISIAMVDTGASLSATLDYSPAGVENAVGLPVRSDVAVILRGSIANGGQSPHEQVQEITRVDGYVDLVFNNPPPAQYPQPPVTQRYYPRFVITKLDSGVDCITPELQLLALSTSTLLTRQMAWGAVFKPRYGIADDLRDIGAVGYEVNLSPDPNAARAMIDTKSASFDGASLFQLLTATVHDALIYSMDIEENGELSWLHQNFIAAANNNQDAYRAIVEAANRLTDNHFGRFWQNGPIAVDDLNRIHLGYYQDRNGNMKDIRDLDYLAMLNLLGEKDMATVVNWSQTFDDVNTPMEIRLERRAKIMRALNDVTIKGYARRITFTPEFITALSSASASAGLVIRPNNLMADFSGQGQRGAYNAQAFAVGNQATGGLFNYAQPGFGIGNRGSATPFFSRFQNR